MDLHDVPNWSIPWLAHHIVRKWLPRTIYDSFRSPVMLDQGLSLLLCKGWAIGYSPLVSAHAEHDQVRPGAHLGAAGKG